MKNTSRFVTTICVVLVVAAVAGEGIAVAQPDVWITPNPPWDNMCIWLSALPVEGTTVTIFAEIPNTGSVDVVADIKFEWGYIGASTAPAFWNLIGTHSGLAIPAGLSNIASQLWTIPTAAIGHSCVRVTINQPTVPPESNTTPANSAWENLWVIVGQSGEETESTGPVINPDDEPRDIEIQFNEVYLPDGWDAWLSAQHFDLVGPGETRDLTVYFSIPQTAVPGDSALANFEVFLLPTGEHIGGTDIRVIVAPEEEIPTLTEWGLIIFGVVLLGFITWVFLKRRKVVSVRV